MKTTANQRIARLARLKAAGLRPIQLWVPDTRAPGFREECQRQSQMLRNDPQETEILAWIEKAQDHEGWR